MKEVRLYKAQARNDESIPSLAIIISDELPSLEIDTSDVDDFLYRSDQRFQQQARKLHKALRYLPGGTIDRLLVLMLQDKASSLTVPANFRGKKRRDE